MASGNGSLCIVHNCFVFFFFFPEGDPRFKADFNNTVKSLTIICTG